MATIPITRSLFLLPFVGILDEIGAPSGSLLKKFRLPLNWNEQSSFYIPLLPALSFIEAAQKSQNLEDFSFLAGQRLHFSQPAKNFSCAMDVDISKEQTPHIYRLMERVLTDAGLSTYGVKNKYNRTRPFVVHNEGTCQPDEEDVLRHDGSYPSGHTAAGWAWALTLAKVNPNRTDELLKRGLSFGQSRVICNAHWQSDVDAGRIMATATVARLHSNPEFLADIQGARKELETASAPVKTVLRKTKY